MGSPQGSSLADATAFTLGPGQYGPITPQNVSAFDSAQYENLQAAGVITQVAGVAQQEIARYFQEKQATYNAESKALSAELSADLGAINASMTLEDASSIDEAGKQAKATLTMRAGMEMAQNLTRQGARGIQIGAGSAAETQASLDLIKEIDAYTIDSNTMRQVESQRMAAVTQRTQSLMAGVSAQNIRSMAQGPGLGSTLISGASRIGSEYLYQSALSANRQPRFNYA